MANTDPTFVAGDSLSVLEVQFVDHSTRLPKDLNGFSASLTFQIVDELGAILQAVQTVAMVVLSPSADGKAKHQFSAAQLLGGTEYETVGGRLQWEAYVSDGAGNDLTSLERGEEWVRGRIAAL